MKKLFYIGERQNPQLKTYYIAYGQLTKKDAKKKENCAYGSLYLKPYNSEIEYKQALENLKTEGHNVH